jgi:15-cis-phytoene synthase
MRFEIDRLPRAVPRRPRSASTCCPSVGACIGAAHALYGRILDKIEAQDYDVFTSRASVSTTEKATMVAKLLPP